MDKKKLVLLLLFIGLIMILIQAGREQGIIKGELGKIEKENSTNSFFGNSKEEKTEVNYSEIVTDVEIESNDIIIKDNLLIQHNEGKPMKSSIQSDNYLLAIINEKLDNKIIHTYYFSNSEWIDYEELIETIIYDYIPEYVIFKDGSLVKIDKKDTIKDYENVNSSYKYIIYENQKIHSVISNYIVVKKNKTNEEDIFILSELDIGSVYRVNNLDVVVNADYLYQEVVEYGPNKNSGRDCRVKSKDYKYKFDIKQYIFRDLSDIHSNNVHFSFINTNPVPTQKNLIAKPYVRINKNSKEEKTNISFTNYLDVTIYIDGSIKRNEYKFEIKL